MCAPFDEKDLCPHGTWRKSGGELLLKACSVLAAGDESIEVTSCFCSGECPPLTAMLTPRRGSIEAYEATCSTVEEALASAEAICRTALTAT